MAGRVMDLSSDDALLQDEYRAPKGGKKKGRKPPPKKKGKKKAVKKGGRDFRGIKNGVKDSGPGPVAKRSKIYDAMAGC